MINMETLKHRNHIPAVYGSGFFCFSQLRTGKQYPVLYERCSPVLSDKSCHSTGMQILSWLSLASPLQFYFENSAFSMDDIIFPSGRFPDHFYASRGQ